MRIIRELFSPNRSIDRRIEKVIDYRANDDKRLEDEVGEYEVTASVERGMRRLLEAFDEGVRGGSVTETGVWVSGFYGSGKSSFTKYLGFALEGRRVGKAPFLDLLAERITHSKDVGQLLRAIAMRHRTAVFMIDLGTDQLADSANESVANVIYWNVLKELGFSREKKVAELELRLFREGRLDAFRRAYAERYPGKESWDEIHNDLQIAVSRASVLVPAFYPDDFKDAAEFRQLQIQPTENVRELAARIIELIQRHRKCESILFFVDEVGQYVAPRQALILNLDGFARALKEVGQGKVWFIATAQQTLQETTERAALNSAELFKLKDRFPITVELESTDIREITARRLLTKTKEGNAELARLWKAHGELVQMHTHLAEWPGGRLSLDAELFARLYPFLPARFDLVLSLIRALSRRSGTGLRSAIRVVQDLLVDKSRMLPKDAVPLADRAIGRLVAVDDVYDTLRDDLRKEVPQAVEGVDRIAAHPDFGADLWAVRAAKAVAALQPLEYHPRTAENIAALLYDTLGAPGQVEAVQKALHRLVDAREFGLVELRADASGRGGDGYLFLSNEVQPIQKKRDDYEPPQAELNAARLEALRSVVESIPPAQIDGAKTVRAQIRLGKVALAGEDGEVLFRLDDVEPGQRAARAEVLVVETQTRDDAKDTVYWIFERPDVEAQLRDLCRSRFIQVEGHRSKERASGVSSDVERFLRSELSRERRTFEGIGATYRRALQKGVFVFRGRKRAVEELGTTVTAGATAFLQEAGGEVFRLFSLVKKNVAGEVAMRFLSIDRLDNMPKERDPLGLVETKQRRTAINKTHPALAEASRAFRTLVAASGSGRVGGGAVLDHFLAAPYGWTKDTTRYLFAALLMAGEIELHTGDGILRTAGPKAVEAFRNIPSFSRAGLAPRGQPVPIEALDRASRRLEEMFGVEVLPLEDQVSRVVRTHFPTLLEKVGSLPDRLRLLQLPGVPRARTFLQTCADLLKEDAGGAASVLGTKENIIPSEAKWATGVVQVLENDGEEDIRAAREMRDRLREVAELFASVEALLHAPAALTIAEVLGSESFNERIADLRQATRVLRETARGLYQAERARLAEALKETTLRLQAKPGWMAITEEEREELGGELRLTALPEEPQDPIGALQKVLTRRLGLAGVEDRLSRAIDARVAARHAVEEAARRASTSAPVEGRPPPEEAPEPEVVSFDALLPEGTLATPADVDRWLSEAGGRLHERLEVGPFRLTVKR